MASITKQFTQKATQAWAAHPLFRPLKAIVDAGGTLRVGLFRPREGLAYAPARLYITQIDRAGTPSLPREYDWDPVANRVLIQLQARCDDRDQEIMRFALMAQTAFEPIETRVGDGYFNAVLLGRLRSPPFDEQPHLRHMLSHVARQYDVAPGSGYDECLAQIESAIGQLSEDLTNHKYLGYGNEEADAILDGALAQYVDERFSVTSRQLMGWS